MQGSRKGNVIFAALLVALTTTLLVIGLQSLFLGFFSSEVHLKQTSGRTDELQILQAEQRAVLGEYRILDPDSGRYAIPVERAMELVIRESVGGSRKPF